MDVAQLKLAVMTLVTVIGREKTAQLVSYTMSCAKSAAVPTVLKIGSIIGVGNVAAGGRIIAKL